MPKPAPGSEIIGPAELRARTRKKKNGRKLDIFAPYTFASSPLSDSLEQASRAKLARHKYDHARALPLLNLKKRERTCKVDFIICGVWGPRLTSHDSQKGRACSNRAWLPLGSCFCKWTAAPCPEERGGGGCARAILEAGVKRGGGRENSGAWDFAWAPSMDQHQEPITSMLNKCYITL